ncbi:MAG TPA: NrfD/PsrC family molybdoenzyme membrane anchor subunit [Capsulimonadaceae bacterium]|nr:NrfD/PsrC family molybdoenzyme membrane anchor subunit [Capsulimonadaceae bacterium]
MANDAAEEPKLTPEALLGLDEAPRKRRREAEEEPSYYDISLLKPPVWTPEVAAYFFLGGLSAGAFLIARCAERCGDKNSREITRLGAYLSAAAALPCAPLLIKDLGDPKRFHHMLRVFKPTSPMNFGTWVVTVFSAVSMSAAFRAWLRAKEDDKPMKGFTRFLDQSIGTGADVIGAPTAIMLAGYTGVLLSTTSTPVWCKNRWLGALFTASAMGAGASAIDLALETKAPAAPSQDSKQVEIVAKIETAAHIAEAAALAGYLAEAGELAKPLTKGKQAPFLWAGAVAAGLILPTVLRHAPTQARWRKGLRIAASVLALVGGAALRWAFVEAGKESAEDPDAARKSSRARTANDALGQYEQAPK